MPRRKNFESLTESGVLVEPERLSKAERDAIESLTPEEVQALTSAFKKMARAGGKKGFWRYFCF
jgi:hypothetical protein